MPGDERAAAALAAAPLMAHPLIAHPLTAARLVAEPSMRLAGIMMPGEADQGTAAQAEKPKLLRPTDAPWANSGAAPLGRSQQAVIVLACDDIAAQREHLARLAMSFAPWADDGSDGYTLSPADTGTCAIRFVRAEPASAETGPQHALAAIDIAALAPQRLADHLASIIGTTATRDTLGRPTIAFGHARLRFVVAGDDGEGLAAIEWAAPGPASTSAT